MSLTLTNYWWLLIWLFLGGAILNKMPKRRERLNGETVERWDILPAFLLVLPYIVWAGFRGDVADTKLYRLGFERASANLLDIPELFFGDTKDPGYKVLEIILKFLIGDNREIYFLIIAAFQMFCIMAVFRRYSRHFWICIFLFIASTDYMSWMMNGMRQFIAATAIFAGFGLMLNKKYIPLIGIIVLVSTIHQSALLMLPIIFIVQGRAWNLKTLLMLAITMVLVTFIDRFTPLMEDMLQDTQYDDALSSTTDDGTNVIRVVVYSVPALLSLLGLRYVRAADNPVINMSVNCAIVTMAIYLISMVTSGIYIGRLPIYTTLQGYIALPWLIAHIFERKSARFVVCIMVLLYCGFFVYQMGITWNYL